MLNEQESVELERYQKQLKRRYAWRHLFLILGIVNEAIGCASIIMVIAVRIYSNRASLSPNPDLGKTAIWIGVWFATLGLLGLSEFYSVKALQRHVDLIHKKYAHSANLHDEA